MCVCLCEPLLPSQYFIQIDSVLWMKWKKEKEKREREWVWHSMSDPLVSLKCHRCYSKCDLDGARSVATHSTIEWILCENCVSRHEKKKRISVCTILGCLSKTPPNPVIRDEEHEQQDNLQFKRITSWCNRRNGLRLRWQSAIKFSPNFQMAEDYDKARCGTSGHNTQPKKLARWAWYFT